ncbi:MAG TPA: ABC transporter permease [Chthonomonadaceae bacterium]|nr:ABC transporter permease [Chthonomonadaceae bacterium]
MFKAIRWVVGGPAQGSDPSSGVRARWEWPAEIGILAVCALVFFFFAWQLPEFSSFGNLRLLAKQAAQLALVSTGMTLVIATGGIDISVGSLVGLCSMALGWLAVRAGWNIWLAGAGAVVTGALVGLGNGLLIARAKLPPIIVTLATFAAARAAASLFNNDGSFSDLPLSFNETFDRTNLAGLPLLFWIGLLSLAGGSLILRRTTFGRELLALGGNRTAARLAGLPTARIETLVYVISGGLAGFAAVINTALKATATPDAGQFLELTAITAVVLGGTSIAGGQATMVGTGLGVVTIVALLSGVRLYGQEDQVAWFLVGAALLLAVEVQRWRARHAKTD